MRTALNFAIVALIALLIVVIPGGGPVLDIALAALSIAFFLAIALLGARLYREYAFTLESLSARERLVLYGAIALAFLTFTATRRLFDLGPAGALAWIALLAAASYGAVWVFLSTRRYG